jgi:hypothetical protein
MGADQSNSPSYAEPQRSFFYKILQVSFSLSMILALLAGIARAESAISGLRYGPSSSRVAHQNNPTV